MACGSIFSQHLACSGVAILRLRAIEKACVSSGLVCGLGSSIDAVVRI